MRLTKQQRADFFAGKFPRITYPGGKPCPVEKGETYWLSSLRKLVVTGIRRSRKGEWVVLYEVRLQERPLYLAPSPKPRFKKDKNGRWVLDDKGWSREQARGYTRSRSRSLDPEAESLDLDELDRQRKRSEERWVAQEADRVGDLLSVCEDLRRAVGDLDPEMKQRIGREIWTLRSRIDALERKLKQKAAA